MLASSSPQPTRPQSSVNKESKCQQSVFRLPTDRTSSLNKLTSHLGRKRLTTLLELRQRGTARVAYNNED